MKILLLTLLFLLIQTDEQTIGLSEDDVNVTLRVPASWFVDDDNNRIEARAADAFYIGAATPRVVLQIGQPDSFVYGQVPAEDTIGSILETIAATLPITGDFPPEIVSEVERFTWDGYAAAAFLIYQPGYYAQWFGIEIDAETLLILEIGSTLVPDTLPDDAMREQFADIRSTLTINGSSLEQISPDRVLNQIPDPVGLVSPVVTSLRLDSGLEVRIAAPPDWFQRDVTLNANFPTTMFFQDAMDSLEEGNSANGSIIQASLLDAERMQTLMGIEALPPAGVIAETYMNYVTFAAHPDLLQGERMPFTWGDYPAEAVAVRYPPSIAAHSGGTLQHLIVVEIDSEILVLTIFVPELQWDSIAPVWNNIVASLAVRGVALPNENVPNAVFPGEE